MSRDEVVDDSGNRPQMSVAKALGQMMTGAAKVADKKNNLEIVKIERALAFIELGEQAGFSAQGLVDQLKGAIALAEEKKDTRALTRLMELSFKIFTETQNNVGDQIIKLTQTQIKLDGKGGGKEEGLSEDDVRRVLIEQLTDTVGD